MEKGVLPLTRLLDRVAWVVLFAMMTMTVVDVLLRKFTNMTIIGAGETDTVFLNQQGRPALEALRALSSSS